MRHEGELTMKEKNVLQISGGLVFWTVRGDTNVVSLAGNQFRAAGVPSTPHRRILEGWCMALALRFFHKL
jgi:hypothetical protein